MADEEVYGSDSVDLTGVWVALGIYLFFVIILFAVGYSYPIQFDTKQKPSLLLKILNGFFASLFFFFWILFKIVSIAASNNK